MNIGQGLPLAVSIALCSLVPVQAESSGQNKSFFPAGDKADAPFGFIEMCERDRGLCLLGQKPEARMRPVAYENRGSPLILKASYSPSPALQGDEARAVEATPEPPSSVLMQMLKTVNKAVNHAVVQVSDMDNLGIPEYWSRLSNDRHPAGDCEDIAIEKRVQLEQSGFPPQRLFYAVAFVPRFGLHTLLVARLDSGDYVLDSISPHVLRWDQVHYVWLRQQMPGRPLVWTRVDGKGTDADHFANNLGEQERKGQS